MEQEKDASSVVGDELQELEDHVLVEEEKAKQVISSSRLSKYQRRKIRKQAAHEKEVESDDSQIEGAADETAGDSAEEDDFQAEEGACELCGSHTRITFHHLIPKLIIKRMKKRGKKVDVIGANICRRCHSTLHHTWGHKELAKAYASLEELKRAPELQAHTLRHSGHEH